MGIEVVGHRVLSEPLPVTFGHEQLAIVDLKVRLENSEVVELPAFGTALINHRSQLVWIYPRLSLCERIRRRELDEN